MASAATPPAKPRLAPLQRDMKEDANGQLQSLKETFAAKLPGEIEKIKKLRKYVFTASAWHLKTY